MKWTKIRRIRSAVFCFKTYWIQKQKQRWANQTRIALGWSPGSSQHVVAPKPSRGATAWHVVLHPPQIQSTMTRQVWVEMVKLQAMSSFCKFCKFYGRNSCKCTSAAFRLKFWSILIHSKYCSRYPLIPQSTWDPQIHIAPAFHRLAPPNVLPSDPGPTARTPAGQHCLARSRCRDHGTSWSKWESNTYNGVYVHIDLLYTYCYFLCLVMF